MKTTTVTLNLNTSCSLDSFSSERYEIISNETLTDCFHRDLNVSGSLLSLSTFKNVTFFGCVFFGSKLQDCKFVNCKFIACEFKFTQMEECEFVACNFESNRFMSSTIKNSEFNSSELDEKTAFVAAKDGNHVVNCFSSRSLHVLQSEQEEQESEYIQDEISREILRAA